MNNQTSNFTTIYSKGILKVVTATPNSSFSHLLDCACSTIGAEHKERTFLLKRVNFYKFRLYMENNNGVHFSFSTWYTDNRATPAFVAAIEAYINWKENRVAIYVCAGPNKIDTLLAKAIDQTYYFRSLVERM